MKTRLLRHVSYVVTFQKTILLIFTAVITCAVSQVLLPLNTKTAILGVCNRYIIPLRTGFIKTCVLSTNTPGTFTTAGPVHTSVFWFINT